MREVPISRGRFVALVDDEDYERIAAHRWHRSVNGYAIRWVPGTNNGRRITMHREVLGFPDARYLDHANGDGLDNQRANLRLCSARDNARNSRALIGQCFKGIQSLSGGTWRTRIRIDGHLTHIGCYPSALDAALAYDAAARLHFGEFACVNFPLEGERRALVAA